IGAASVNNTAIIGNRIGTNAAGTAAVANLYGVGVGRGTGEVASGTVIQGNLISGNTLDGVLLEGGGVAGTGVAGNVIGTDASGPGPLPNQGDGVLLEDGTNNNTVGGTVAAARNVISGNGDSGVDIEGAGVSGNVVEGNFIGTNAGGTAALGNGFGIEI